MIKGKSPKLLLAILATASLTFSMISCGDDDKKDDPTPVTTNPTTTTCINLDPTQLAGKKWYKVGSSGNSWIEFKIVDSTWTSQNVPYSTVDNKGTWVKSSNSCVITMDSRKNNSQNIQPIKIISIGTNEVTIGNKMDFSNIITYKTTP